MDYTPHSLANIAPVTQTPFSYSFASHRHPRAQQVYGAHGTSQAIGPGQQEHFSSGQVASPPYYAPHPSGLYTVLPNCTGRDAELAYNGQSVSVTASAPSLDAPLLMGPPARQRKRKAQTLRADKWEP